MLTSPKGDKLRYVLQINFEKPSNNEAEYEALLHGMRMAKACGATRLMIYGDSNLIVQQTMGDCEATADNMIAYRNLYNILEGEFDGCELHHIARAHNTEADALANIGSTRGPIPLGVFLEQIDRRSIKPKKPLGPSTSTVGAEVAAPADPEVPAAADAPEEVLLVEPVWTRPFLDYMAHKQLPGGVVEA